jgi:hypothetical protein
VKKVGPPFSQDSPETGKLRDELSKQSSIHLLKYHVTNWKKNRSRPASLKFLVHKKLDPRMVISPEFKGRIPSIQSLQGRSESYTKSDLHSKLA